MNRHVVIRERMYKMAAAYIEMGEPATAGKGIADIVRFLLQRISPIKRQVSLNKLRKKIWDLNEVEISLKKTPQSASLGQSLTFIKTILQGHDPKYIRSVLAEIHRNLY